MIRCTRFVTAVLSLWSTVVFAGSFDCSVVYDEFENLMNRQYLVEPSAYVSTVTDRLTREEFSALQQGKLHLRSGRQDMGVAIVHTNRRTRGKLVFNWDGRTVGGYPPLVIEETIIYGRVSDGYAPRRLRPILVKPGFAVDLDSGRVSVAPSDLTPLDNVDNTEQAADLAYSAEGERLAIEAINGATLEFPIESMCKP